jgi:hypothetical protein
MAELRPRSPRGTPFLTLGPDRCQAASRAASWTAPRILGRLAGSRTMSAMLEIAVVLITVAAAGLLVSLAAIVTAGLTTLLGLALLVLGLAVGVPTGFWYHVELYRLTSPKIPLPPRWWLSPGRLHRHLTAAEQRRIEPWFRIGGAGFVLCVAGGVAAIAGLLAR